MEIWTAHEQLPDVDALRAYARAEARGERRFFAECPDRGERVVGLGCALDLERRPGESPAALGERARERSAGRGEELRWLGGLAFEARPSEARDPAWRAFGDGRFWLPELCIDSAGRLTWTLAIGPDDDPARRVEELRGAWLTGDASEPSMPELRPSDAGVRAPRYASSAQQLIDAIRGGAARKVVLAEVERLALSAPLPAAPVVERLRRTHPGCVTFAIGIGAATFIGATPERMLGLADGRVRASALAGTVARGADEASAFEELRRSSKDRAEHAFVVDAIGDALRERCTDVEIPSEPELMGTGNIAHLHTEVTGRARPGAHLLELVEPLHPTPAVAGTPRPDALELIRKHETFDRGWYAGAIGWMTGDGEGEVHVALRCGLALRDELRLFAGAGLVEASDAEREAAETRLKLSALRDALEQVCGT